jgi:hypothetical protein
MINWEQLRQADPEDVRSIAVPAETVPLPVSDVSGSSDDLYHASWGYFTFGQGTGFVYNEAKAYRSQTTYTLVGTFTIGAETALGAVASGASDATKFAHIASKLTTLETMLANAGRAEAPAALADWGTASDDRCVALPAPLLDVDGATVYAQPVALNIEQTQWPQLLRYQCTLVAPEVPAAKLRIGYTLIDRGMVTMNFPSPVLHPSRMMGTAGAVLHVQNYTLMTIGLAGQLPHLPASGASLSVGTADLATELANGTTDIAVLTPTTQSILWEDLALTRVSLPISHERETVQVSVQGTL